jgi:hypothetical protein
MSLDASNSVAAHLILGQREEPFLAALIDSIESAAGLLIVNDNSSGTSPHAATLESSSFGKAGRLIVARSAFGGFATARNLCLQLHAKHSRAGWVAFVDADEVHEAQTIATIARNLQSVPTDYDFVDGYTWHFFQSFDYYTSIERRMMFFRYRSNLQWEGVVHEHLLGLRGKRIALPYVYGHYGHTLTPRRHAEKGRHYSALGAPGNVLPQEQLDGFDVAKYFAPVYPRLLRFSGSHPASARSTLAQLASELAAHHRLTERIVDAQPARVKIRNVWRKLNYELRWRSRVVNPRARELLRAETRS